MSPLISLAVFAVVGAGVSIFWLKRLANQSEKRMREQFPAAKARVRGANFFGQESRGKAQLRGNGTLTANCLTFFKIGACNVLITNPRDIPAFVAELGKHPFTVITGVNTLFNALLNNPEFEKLDFRTLRVALGGGMAVQQAVADRWKQVTGKTLAEAYGLTETSPAVCINPLDLPEFNHSIGLPISSTDVSLRDDDGYEVSMGIPGELCVKGPQVMKGSYTRPEDTPRAFTHDGHLRTGDVVTIDDDGFVRIVDRMMDMILVSGFYVFPNEVEDVVAAHPGVMEVAALGVADEHSGEAVKM